MSRCFRAARPPLQHLPLLLADHDLSPLRPPPILATDQDDFAAKPRVPANYGLRALAGDESCSGGVG